MSGMSTYETTQPWVLYHYGRTHDKGWPPWRSSRVLGRARIGMECMVCGVHEVVSLKMPRFGPLPVYESGRHPAREKFLAQHRHPDRGSLMSWAVPLANLAAHPGGLDLDALAMRLETDINYYGGTPQRQTRDDEPNEQVEQVGKALFLLAHPNSEADWNAVGVIGKGIWYDRARTAIGAVFDDESA
jgi:hypothetical protein